MHRGYRISGNHMSYWKRILKIQSCAASFLELREPFWYLSDWVLYYWKRRIWSNTKVPRALRIFNTVSISGSRLLVRRVVGMLQNPYLCYLSSPDDWWTRDLSCQEAVRLLEGPSGCYESATSWQLRPTILDYDDQTKCFWREYYSKGVASRWHWSV